MHNSNTSLTLNLLTTTIVAPPSNASKWQMGFKSAFKGLNSALDGRWVVKATARAALSSGTDTGHPLHKRPDGYRAGLDGCEKSHIHEDSISGLSSLSL